ncbi:MAG: HAD family hydrolase [Actinomycetota bacterium]|jgi:putative hydrolase of the HAD superfamily|nr:HAD family hydrolase [Rubrobacter sp.]MDQ3508224.1 HAD family hydrolase [Actinomycetota bacterium]
MTETKAVLFDLDDTLFDHAFAARRALEVIHGDLPRFAEKPFETLESEYSILLEEVHLRVLAGELTLEEARRDRMRTLLSGDERMPADSEVDGLASRFRDGYQENRRVAEGVHELLGELRERGILVGVVTNNLTAEQKGKLAFCRLDSLVDFMVTSEEVGSPKPERAIFEAALERADCRASEAVVVGDSWESDILGARNAGIRAVWYNPKNLPRPDSTLADELRSFQPVGEAALGILLNKGE